MSFDGRLKTKKLSVIYCHSGDKPTDRQMSIRGRVLKDVNVMEQYLLIFEIISFNLLSAI